MRKLADKKLALIAVVAIILIAGGVYYSFLLTGGGGGATTTPTGSPSPTGGGTTPTSPPPTSPTPSGPTFAGQIIILRDNSPKSLDPTKTTWTNDYGIIANIYSTLVGYKKGTRDLVPDLAESWEVSPDGLVYTFHLRHGVKWQKGWGEFTAQDVKFTFDRILNPNISVIYRSLFSALDHVEVVDNYTVKFVLKSPDPAFLYALAPYRNGFIICKKYYESLSDPETEYGKNPVGTGPYQLEYYNEETGEVKLTAFQDYYGWEPGPHVKDIIYKPIADDDLRFQAFIGGEGDVYSVTDPEKLAQLKDMAKSGDIVILEQVGTGITSLEFNMETDIYLKDIRIRKAFAYAINRTYIVKEIMGDTVVEAVGWLPVGGYLYATNDVPQYPYNLDKAKQLVDDFKADTGYTNITIKFQLPNAFPFVDIGEYIQSQMKKVGVNIELAVMDFASWYDALVVKGVSNLTYLPLGGRPPEPSIILKTCFSIDSIPPGGINFARYRDVDPLIKQALNTTDENERAQIYKNIQVKLMEDLPIYPLYYEKLIIALKKDIKNFTPDNFNWYGDWMEYVYVEGAAPTTQSITTYFNLTMLLVPPVFIDPRSFRRH